MLRARFLPVVLAVVLTAAAPLLSACTSDEPTVALLVADGTDSSSQAVDVDAFTDRVEATCDECRVRVYDAEGDADLQKSQARQAEATSADVVVVVPVEPDDLGTLTGSGLPVVSLGELVPGAERHVGLEGGSVPSRAGSDLDAARDVVLGEKESMTYVPVDAMSERAADLAVAFLAESTVADGEVVDGVETWLYRDREVTIDTLTSVLVSEGVVEIDELCSGPTEKRCTRLGLR